MKKNNKGFTLAELLIVVAIIAVLVAIAIPIFTTQLEKSRDAVSVSNIRAGYAEVMSCVIAGTAGQTRVTGPANGGDGDYAITVTIKSQQDNDWSGVATELAFVDGTIITASDFNALDTGANADQSLQITITDGAISAVDLS
ncbi:MAG: prepilin-type N-terminal cleavage/methylation domain-containing protein [Oscillospiraceae bacterium]|nr:prepilin-type N-terminal cleavage/methylation domain-containing protein [Oscillospiraceae bacterium]